MTLFAAIIPFIGFAQQDAQYTQYMYNTSSINPAYAGSRDMVSFSGLHREQWVNVSGAPVTQTANFDTSLGRQNKVGLGLSLVNDRIFPTTETNFTIDFSYTLKFDNDRKLSFGTKLGGSLLNADISNLSRDEMNDATLENNVDNKFNPNFGFGLYFYTNKFYVGLSVPSILETTYFDNDSTSSGSSSNLVSEEKMNYYLITGHTFDLTSNIKFKPALLTKLVIGAPLQVDVSANFLFNEKLTLGAAYRWSAAVSGIVGFQVFRSLMIGVAFDYETTELSNTQFNNGSFEFMLRYDLINKQSKNSNRMITPRFF